MICVFSTEDGSNEILGEHVRYEEDGVIYRKPGGIEGVAPYDCVKVREVTGREIRAEIDRFGRLLTDAKNWVTNGGYGDTGMNSLLALAVEMTRYAEVMGSALTVDAAAADVRRRVKEGYFIESRAHSRALESAAV